MKKYVLVCFLSLFLFIGSAYSVEGGKGEKAQITRADKVSNISQLAQSLESCVCNCVYQGSDRIQVPGYFSKQGESSCQAIEGKACVSIYRNVNFRGYLLQCEEAPVSLRN